MIKVKRSKLFRLFSLFLVLIGLFLIINPGVVVKADTAPKPYVEIEFKNVTEEEYFVTLLSKRKSSGPHYYYEDGEPLKGDYPEIWQKFQDFEDNYYFLQNYKKLTKEETYTWGYMPPRDFKVLVYFPSLDKMIVSEPYEMKAFVTHYVFDLVKIEEANGKLETITAPISLKYESQVGKTIWQLLLRIAFTLAIEILVALVFLFITKRQLLTILFTNLVTQIGLNILISLAIYFHGINIFYVIFLVFLEVLIFILEAVTYHIAFGNELKAKSRGIWQIYLYSFVANLLSFGVGSLLLFLL